MKAQIVGSAAYVRRTKNIYYDTDGFPKNKPKQCVFAMNAVD